MRGEDEISPGRRARAERLAAELAAHASAPLPYPSREAVDVVDGGLLLVVERFRDPEWLARHWLGDREDGGSGGD